MRKVTVAGVTAGAHRGSRPGGGPGSGSRTGTRSGRRSGTGAGPHAGRRLLAGLATACLTLSVIAAPLAGADTPGTVSAHADEPASGTPADAPAEDTEVVNGAPNPDAHDETDGAPAPEGGGDLDDLPPPDDQDYLDDLPLPDELPDELPDPDDEEELIGPGYGPEELQPPDGRACPDDLPQRFSDSNLVAVHRDAIECLAWWGIAGGFDDGTFRPDGAVTRGQLASFAATAILAAGGELPPPGAVPRDARDSVHRRAIGRMMAAGLMRGFADGSFGPEVAVTRGQLATTLLGVLRHLDVSEVEAAGTSSASSHLDVPGTAHAAAIDRLTAAGLVRGFADGTFRPGDAVTRGQLASTMVGMLGAVVASGGQARAAHLAVDRAALAAAVCWRTDTDVSRATEVLAGTVRLHPHPPAELGTDIDWAADPFGQPNWQFQLHALRWLFPLINASRTTGDERYRDHALQVARDWVLDNPPDAPAADFAWDDHATAWRAMVLGCLAMHPEVPVWLTEALELHRAMLADDDFYVTYGNHALNQDIGLTVAACLTNGWDGRDLAAERLVVLAERSIDEQGVTDEQATEYQNYNLQRYRAAYEVQRACGMPTPRWHGRLLRMPGVLAHLTQPDGLMAPIGDTDHDRRTPTHDDPAVRWITSNGLDGAPPLPTFVTFEAGYTVARSSWGTPGALGEESYLTLRHGPPRRLHGHEDHGAITLFSQGQRLVTTPGKYAYGPTAERAHVISQAAQNVVVIGEDCPPDRDRNSEVLWRNRTATTDEIAIDVATCPGTGWVRTVVFVRATGEVIVIDELSGVAGERVTQRWQLDIGAEVVRHGAAGGATASWPSGAALRIEPLRPHRELTVVAGGRDPLRGWVSPRYAVIEPAPNIEVTATDGANATFVTVLRPGRVGGVVVDDGEDGGDADGTDGANGGDDGDADGNGDGDGSNGDSANGNGAHGDGTNGDGDGTNGDGAGTNGGGANGDGANGDGANGDGTNGDGANGNGADSTDGPGTNGPDTNGTDEADDDADRDEEESGGVLRDLLAEVSELTMSVDAVTVTLTTADGQRLTFTIPRTRP